MIGRPSIEKLFNDLLVLQSKLNAAGRFSLAAGREIVALVSQVRSYFAELNEDAVNVMRAEFEGDDEAVDLINLLAVKTDADSMQVVKLLSKDLVEKLSLLMQQVPSDIEEDVFVSDFGTTRVLDAIPEGPKPFLVQNLKLKPQEYLAKRSVSTFFASGDLPKQPEEVSPLRGCAKALLELAALEGKKGSKTGNIASYMSKTKTLRDSYDKLTDAEKAILNRAMDNSGVKKIVDAIVDKNNRAPASNKATALWMAIRKNDRVKTQLSILLEEKKVRRASAPVFGNDYN